MILAAVGIGIVAIAVVFFTWHMIKTNGWGQTIIAISLALVVGVLLILLFN